MKWLEIKIETDDKRLEEPINALLFEIGVSGIASEEREGSFLIKGFIPSNLFDSSLEDKLKRSLQEISLIFPAAKILFSIKDLEEIDWAERWKKFFRPVQVSRLLTVVPSWEKCSPNTKYVIRIDPGPAFGTGQHPSTKLCLRAMEEVKIENMLDIGTGTGILAIYAALLGAKRILAIDIDPIAIKWARHNIELNRVSDKVILSDMPVQNISDRFSTVVANLLFDELMDVLPYIPSFLKEDGHLITSGILDDQKKGLLDKLKDSGFKVLKEISEEEWVCFICAKQS